MQPVRLAMIGTGNMGQRAHLDQYITWPDCRMVALAEPRHDLATQVAARYGIEKIYSDHRSLLDDERDSLDGFVCIQPYRYHQTILPELYQAGKPVLTEKPLALSVAAAEVLAERAHQYRVPHMVAYHKRCDPAMEYGKSVTDDWKKTGCCGRMTYLRVTMPPGDWTWNGFARTLKSREPYPVTQLEPIAVAGLTTQQAKAYDTFVNYYIHQINAIRFLLGEDYQVVYAEPSGRLLVGQSMSGVPVVLEMAPWSNTTDWLEQYLVCFEKATVKISLPAPLASQQPGTLELMIDNGQGLPRLEQPMLPKIDAMRNQARRFIDLIKGTAAAPCLADEAVKDLRLAYDYIRQLGQIRSVSS